MALAITEEHRALADVTRSFAAAHKLRRATRAYWESPDAGPGDVWKAVAGQGWTGLAVPESAGGAGYGLAELAVVVEQLGASVAPGPFLASAAAATVLAAVAPGHELLPGLADGSVIGAVDVARDGGPVIGAAWARLLLLRDGADLLVVPAAECDLEAVPGADPSLGMARVSTAGTGTRIRGAAGAAVRITRALLAAEASGGARQVLEDALAYAKVRKQFGRIIGGFQAVKHHLANMLVEAERATAAAWDAARAAHLDTPEGDLAAAVGVAVAVEAYRKNAQTAIQVFGGIGFTWEHDAHLFLRRALVFAGTAAPVERALDEVEQLVRDGARRAQGLDLPPEAETYREQAREFVTRWKAAPEGARRALLADSGYLMPHWPKPWGREAGAVEQLVLEQELAGIDVPALGIGGWVLLTLIQRASPEQVGRWIPPSLLGELTWCQLFSEPDAGSDAAAVQTRGERVEGGWRINGQKVWTSDAQRCNRGLATVRTDPRAPKHQGITTVALDLTAPGVEVRPLREATGQAAFNEVFFTDVFVPDEDVVGEVNAGWAVARATLGNERVSIGGSAREGSAAAGLVPLLDRYAPGDAGLRREIGAVFAGEQALKLINLRRVSRAVLGAEPGAEGAVTKLLTAEHAQRATELAMRIAGPAGIDGSQPALLHRYLFGRALTIAGGTSEISRNVIAERLLGLPREPGLS
jgi:alkylation response protein AidB-like acyl-CoA dehydrogenase